MSWQERRERASVEAELAIRREIVMERLRKLREEVGHPDRPGKPLPAEEAAARAGVKYRTWQRWESGESVPYAKSLAKVADTFDIELTEFDDGAAKGNRGTTPDLSRPDGISDRLDAIERALEEASRERAQHASEIRALLKRQDGILKAIEERIASEKTARSEAEQARRLLLEAAEVARRTLEDAARRTAATPGPQAK
jgi:transcriptional regulator with XRE-family HTH domain